MKNTEKRAVLLAIIIASPSIAEALDWLLTLLEIHILTVIERWVV